MLTYIGSQLVTYVQANKIKKLIAALPGGMRKNDRVLIQSAFAPAAMMQITIKNKAGQTRVRSINVSDFNTAITLLHKDIYGKRIIPNRYQVASII